MKIASLVFNPCTNDSRVIKQAESLAAAGHQITVFCLTAPGVEDHEVINGVTYHRVPHLWQSDRLELLRRLWADFKSGGSPSRLRSAGYLCLYAPNAIAWHLLRRATGKGGATGGVFAEPDAAPAADSAQANTPPPSALSRLKSRIKGLLNNTGKIFSLWLRYENVRLDFAKAIRAYAPDVIHGHDLYALPATIVEGKRAGAKTVYDAHEWERHRTPTPPALARLWVRMIEDHFIPQADRLITVAPQIAEFHASKHQQAGPVVLLNAPAITSNVRHGKPPHIKGLRDRLGLDADTQLAVFIGVFSHSSALSEVMQAMQQLPDLHIAILGPRNAQSDQHLLAEANTRGLTGRFHLMDPVPSNDVCPTIADADLALVPTLPGGPNHDVSLPNKLFESTMAGLPIAATHLPNIAAFIKDNGIGEIMDPANPEDIARAISAILADPQRYRPDDDKLSRLIANYAWPAQAEKLVALYEGLNPKPDGHQAE